MPSLPILSDPFDLYINSAFPIKVWGHPLEHWHQDYKLVFVTTRLADALPQEVVTRIQEEKTRWLRQHPVPRSLDDKEFFKYHFQDFDNKYADKGHGECYLRVPQAAKIMENCLWEYDGQFYKLYDFVIMPNHIHVLLQLFDHDLEYIVRRWKSKTTVLINKAVGHIGPLWQHDYWETFVKNEDHHEKIVNYITHNMLSGGISRMIPQPQSHQHQPSPTPHHPSPTQLGVG